MSTPSGENTPWLTVGIAAYNSAAYIRRAINSVVRQTDSRVEVIIVNDGSRDNTLARIHDLLASYNEPTRQRITLIDQDNAGVAAVRNIAIDRSRAPYITFLDGDDYWLDHYYDSVLSLIGDPAQAEFDLLEYNVLEDRRLLEPDQKAGRFVRFNPLGNYRGELSTEHLKSIFTASKWYVWTRIYRKSLFDGLRFPRELHYEDMMLVPQLYLRARTIIATEDPLIAYRINLGGQVCNPAQRDIDDVSRIIDIHLNIARKSSGHARDLMVLLACQSALYFKIMTNIRLGYIGSLGPIRRRLATIQPMLASRIKLPMKTRLLFMSPLASNLYTWLKTRPQALKKLGKLPEPGKTTAARQHI
ncbi:glycosyltransferase involved in cell wall biosynthesis [Kushneria sinocarnis]|uniref:Glycosyltransferase involved in cell wall biosynthesis n=1 Tax=Kushneria sinocarnis TaxID=595502 RepID=A0A420WW57_9GAMM|nr:glycosyltransferase family 2 protein [Kushneria sinocarnis]RKR03358.1 glycosyltransferase involved in cell wall biosynthesis [Kushneria sinocarnis]